MTTKTIDFEDIRARMGRFTIAKDIVESQPDICLHIMSKVIVVRCEFIPYPAPGQFEYMALSPTFDELEEGMKIPQYDAGIVYMRDDENQVVCHFTGFTHI